MSPDGSTVVSGGGDGGVKVWRGGRVVRSLQLTGKYKGVERGQGDQEPTTYRYVLRCGEGVGWSGAYNLQVSIKVWRGGRVVRSLQLTGTY